jgi:molybdate/tungstate transport system substrate-binding protein
LLKSGAGARNPWLFALSAAISIGACGSDNPNRRETTPADTLVVYLAASLTKPMQPLLDSFAARQRIVVQRESGGSLEHARKITELNRVPDVLLLADAEVFPQLLVPAHANWYAEFARNRMVVAYTDRSKLASEITAANWTHVLRRPEVQVGRTDPLLAPAGYRTLLLFELAERHYREPGLSAGLLDNAPPRNIRANAADLAALLSAGELDYIYEYQSVAETNGFRYVTLPSEIDLGDPARAADYAKASVRVSSPSRRDSAEYVGRPIVYALSIPTRARHPSAGRRFLAFFFDTTTRRALRAAHIDLLDRPIVIGGGAPPEINVDSGR